MKAIENLKIKNFLVLIIVTIIFSFLSLGFVNAQSQEDITKCDFSASSKENLYIQLNYTCRNVTWLPRVYDVYRRVNFENCPVDPTTQNKVDFVNDGNSLTKGTYFVEDYMLFYDKADLSKRETVGQFEAALAGIDGADKGYGPAIIEGNLGTRNLPRPFFVSDDLAKGLLEPYKGFVVCPVYEVVDDKYQSPPTSYVRADLIPPTIQNLENMFVDAFYLIWGFLGIIGLGMLTYLGFEFIWGGNSPEKLGELRTKFSLWLLGILLVILAPSLINFIYSLAGISTTKCYKLKTEDNNEIVYDLTMPGFTFFFKDVCTGEFAVEDERGGDQP